MVYNFTRPYVYWSCLVKSLPRWFMNETRGISSTFSSSLKRCTSPVFSTYARIYGSLLTMHALVIEYPRSLLLLFSSLLFSFQCYAYTIVLCIIQPRLRVWMGWFLSLYAHTMQRKKPTISATSGDPIRTPCHCPMATPQTTKLSREPANTTHTLLHKGHHHRPLTPLHCYTKGITTGP